MGDDVQEWRPGLAVTDASKLCDIACALSFGQSDNAFSDIAALLHKRGCITVGDWHEWSKAEFFTMIKSNADLKLKKNRHAYLKGFESATGHALGGGVDGSSNGLIKAEKQTSGGDMMALSRKVVSKDFNASKWHPDARVYEGVPRAADVEHMDDEAEKLYLDKLWLALQAHAFARSSPCLQSHTPPHTHTCGRVPVLAVIVHNQWAVPGRTHTHTHTHTHTLTNTLRPSRRLTRRSRSATTSRRA